MRALMLIAALAAVFVGDNCENEVVTHTPSSIALPKSMNMMAEDVDHVVFRPTPLPEGVNNSKLEDHKARALNFTLQETHSGNGITNATEHVKGGLDLSDVTIGDDDEEMDDMDMMKPSKEEKKNVTMGFGICEKGGLTYENGEKLENGCDNTCTCRNGKMECEDRCKKPFFRKGKKIEDPLCIAKDTEDSCCSILVCSGDTETEPLEMCSYGNKIYNRGENFNKGCEEVCLCEAGGKISCKSRCPPRNKTTDRCVEIPDPKDSCCKKVLCDVNLDENESEITEEDKLKKKSLVSANYVNDSTILLQFDSSPGDNIVEFSEDKKDWKKYKILSGGYVSVGKDKIKYARSENATLNEVINVKEKSKDRCEYNGKTYKVNDEFNDNCKSFCKCHSDGVMKCLPLQCPTYFGLDVLDPNCIEWETIPPNFEPTAPNCCPESVRCKNDGSCHYKKSTFKNWEQLPVEVTGCEKRCYCEMGNVECQQVCPPVVARPPLDLGCDLSKAFLGKVPGDDCCKFWTCPEEEFKGHMIPGTFPNFHQPEDSVTVHTLEAIDPHTVRLAFMVPRIIVGLHGRVEVRYTHTKGDDEIDSWSLQIFAPPEDLIATPSLEFDLLDLKPDTEYKIKITITLRDVDTTHSSRIYHIRTPKDPQSTSTLPPLIPIEPELSITDINSTWVVVNWRKFTDYELQFIDGIQLRYKETDGKIYAATPLLHRAVTSYTLANVKPNTKYELGIFFVPFPGQSTELHSKHMLHFTTANLVNTYGFNVTLEIGQVKSQSVEVTWSGVPYPEDKYVHIYRAIYQSDTGKEDISTFKMAKRDSATRTIIGELKPGTRYRIWLEVYLTNGKVKTSNVQDFITKPRPAPSLATSSQHDKLSRAQTLESKGDYYGPLVIVAILAAIAVLSTLVLLLILVKRHNQNKAAITSSAARVSQSAYDNPTYKVEIQQETMGL